MTDLERGKKTQKTVAEKRQMLWLLRSQGVLCLSCSPHLKYWQFSKDLAQTTELAQQEGLVPFLYNPTHDPCPPTRSKVCKRGWRQGPCISIFVLIKHASPWNDGIWEATCILLQSKHFSWLWFTSALCVANGLDLALSLLDSCQN